MKPPLEVMFVCCTETAQMAVTERLAREYAPESITVTTRVELKKALRESKYQLLFTDTETDLTPVIIMAERALAGLETPIFVLCTGTTELSALEAVRIGASEAIDLLHMERLLPSVARELRTANLRWSRPSGIRGEGQLQWATSALLHLTRTRSFLGDNLIDDLRQITEVAGSAMDVDRSSIWFYDEPRSKIRCIDLFDYSAGVHSDGTELEFRQHPAYFLAMEQQRLIVAHDARGDPRTREYKDHYLVPLGITSMMDAAVRCRGQLRGVVCLEHVGPARTWTAEEELFAAALADLVSLAMEASERHGIEMTLRETELRCLELFEHTSDAVLILAQRGREWVCETMNPACEQITGFNKIDMIGRDACAMLPAGIPESLVAAFRSCQSGKEVITREHALELPVGTRWFNTVLVPLPNEAGQIHWIACMARDITDHRSAVDRLRESEQRRLLHIQQTPLGVIEWSIGGRVVSWNAASERIFGYSEREAFGRHLNLIIPIEVRPQVDAIWSALITQRGGMRSTNQNVRKDGVYIECEWYNTPLIDEDGRTIGVASTVQDVTANRRNEEFIRRANHDLELRVAERTAQLADANRELEAFCYSVSHDLRAPLRSIDGFSKALLEDCHEHLDADGQDYLRRVRAASQRMGELIDDLLNLSRINRAELRRSHVDLSTLARKIADGLQTANPDRQVDWTIVPNISTDGDKNLLRVLLENLLGNAFKYTGRKERAYIEFGSRDENGRQVLFVRDNGAGFDMTYVDKLFQPFQRLHRPDEFDGHGIGLATAQRVVHRHGGRLWADGKPGHGACFYFTLSENAHGELTLE